MKKIADIGAHEADGKERPAEGGKRHNSRVRKPAQDRGSRNQNLGRERRTGEDTIRDSRKRERDWVRVGGNWQGIGCEGDAKKKGDKQKYWNSLGKVS